MDIFINNEKVELDFNEEGTLNDILNLIKKKLKEENKVITRLIVDEKECIIEDVKDRKIKDIKRIEIEATHPIELTKRAIIDVFHYLPYLKDNLKEIVISLQSGKITHALNSFDDCITALRWINIILLGVEKITQIKLPTSPEQRKELESILRKLITSLEDKNYVLLADLIEYELIPLLDNTTLLITNIIKEFDKKLH